jgi:microcystin-dependent protein
MDNYLGEIRAFAGNYAPTGWEVCRGQLLSISANQALFSLLGTTYGGNGVNDFGLPDLRVRVGLNQGQLAGGSTYVLGQPGGTQNVTLTTGNIPQHTHPLMATTAPATTGDPTNNLLAQTNGTTSTPPPPTPYPDVKLYTTLPLPSGPTTPNVTMDPNSVTPLGGNQPHDNMMPYTCINFIIATQGIYPSQS